MKYSRVFAMVVIGLNGWIFFICISCFSQINLERRGDNVLEFLKSQKNIYYCYISYPEIELYSFK